MSLYEDFQDVLKSMFFSERYSSADAVPRRHAEELSSMPRLTNILPYVAWMENEEIFVLDQGGFSKKDSRLNMGFCIEIQPNTGANEEMEKVLTSLWLSSPAGTGIQVSLFACPNIMPVLRSQANMLPTDSDKKGDEDWTDRRNTNVFRAMARKRIDYYITGTSKPLLDNQNYLLRDFRCVISITMNKDPKNANDVDEVINMRQSLMATLSSANLPGVSWHPEHLINFVAYFFDHSRMLGKEADNILPYRSDEEIRKQLSSLNIASVLADNYIRMSKDGGEETALQSFSVRRYPEYFRLSGMGSLIGDYYQLAMAIPCPFMITMGSIVLDYESARTTVQLKAARATQAAGSKMATLQPELAVKKRDWDMVLRAFDNGRNVIKMYHQIILVSRKDDVSKAADSVNAVWRSRGFELSRDVYLAHQGLMGALPMTLTQGLQSDLNAFGRCYTKTTDNAVMTAPLIAEWKGTRTPVLTLFARRGQIMTFDLFDNDGGNYNFAVSASSGAGKSVFTNEIVFRYLGAGAKVWMVDAGKSYRNLCILMGGEFIEFSENNNICLNPFSMVNDINEDMEILHPLVELMASPKVPLENYESAVIKSAIMTVWKMHGRQATITHIYELLKTGSTDSLEVSQKGQRDVDIVRLATSIEPFTKYGVYAKYFEGEANIRFDKDYIVLELDELKSKKDLQAVVMQIMMFRITQEMYMDRSRKKLCIIDEAWDLMGSGSNTAGFIETGYRRARKYGGAFGTITQSINDYYKNVATRAAIENADWMFLLRQKPESIDMLGKEGKLPLDDWMKRQLNSIITIKHKYSEIFVHSPMGSGVGRLILDPFSALLYSTTSDDFEMIKTLRDQGMSITEAIEHILKNQKRH